MSNYVADYRRLDDNAARAESQAEDFRWQQCRVAYEATAGSDYTFDSFAKAVGVSRRTISRQVALWKAYGVPDRALPDYRDAYRELRDEATGADATREMAVRGARNLPAADKAKLAAELLDDEAVEVAPAVIAKHASKPDVARAIARNDESREAVEEEAIQHRARFRPDQTPQPREEGRKAAAGAAQSMQADLATESLRQAAGIIAEALFEREQFGVDHPDEEGEALGRVERAVQLYKVAAEMASDLTTDDREFLESLGISS